MSQVRAAMMGVMGVLWLTMALASFFILKGAIIGDATNPPDIAFAGMVSGAIGWPALCIGAASLASAYGLTRNAPWARGLAFATTWFSAMTLIGLPWAVAQFFVLQRE